VTDARFHPILRPPKPLARTQAFHAPRHNCTIVSPRHKALGEDNRGAIMVMALFFAVFLVSLLYCIVGTAQAAFQREHLQDAVDGAVLSGAVLDAQAMNLIVLLNIVMAALLAILVALKAVELLCLLGIGIALVAAYFSFGASLAVIPPLNTVRQTVVNLHKTLKDPIYSALRTLNLLADDIKMITPELAKSMAEGRLVSAGANGAEDGIVWAKATSLPVQNDDYTVLCKRAGQDVGNVATMPFKFVLGDAIRGTLSDLSGDVVSGMSKWFCDDSENGPYKYKEPQKVAYPRTEAVSECENSTVSATTNDGMSPECGKVENSAPDEQGYCQRGTDCSLNGPYEKRVALARQQCDPSGTPKPFDYAYQLHDTEVEYVWNGTIWVRQTPAPGNHQYVQNAEKPPCGAPKIDVAVAHGYETSVHPGDNINNLTPVCSTEHMPAPPQDRTKRQSQIVRFREVTHIIGCKKMEYKKTDVSESEADKDNNKSTKSPKKIVDGLKMGHELFRIRAIGVREANDESTERLVRLALWGQAQNMGSSGTGIMWMRRMGYAQAEYFYDGTDGRDGYMWNMSWRARLRRFDLPSERSDLNAIVQLCNRRLEKRCETLFSRFFTEHDLAMH